MNSLHKDNRRISSAIWKCRRGYWNVFGEDPKSGLTSGLSTMTMPCSWCVKISLVAGQEIHYKSGLSTLFAWLSPLRVLARSKIKNMPWRDRDLPSSETSNATWHRYCAVFRKTVCKTFRQWHHVSRSAWLYKESISKAEAAPSAQAHKRCSARDIPGIKLSHRAYIYFYPHNILTEP
jgi:hypothetical protein